MMGRSHVVTSVSVVSALGTALYATAHSQYLTTQLGSWWGAAVQPAALTVWQWLVPVSGLGLVLYGALALVAVWWGSLAPDIDQAHSKAGRYVRRFTGWLQRRPHRGVTHTDWFWLGLLGLSCIPVLRWVIFGWFGAQLHLEFDGLSQAGRVRWYPMTSHRVIHHGGRDMVVPDRFVRAWYRVGHRSELVLVVLTVCLSVIIAALSVTALVL